jgi:hypothetical protein
MSGSLLLCGALGPDGRLGLLPEAFQFADAPAADVAAEG